MKSNRDLKVAALILAHNEAFVIAETVKAVSQALGASDELFVIADNCTDGTKTVAEEAGARVFARTKGSVSNKGQALAWFLENYQKLLRSFDFLLVLDADSRIDPSYLDSVRENLPNKGKVFQSLVLPAYDSQSPIGRLAALSYLLDQYVSDGIRDKLGWSVRLRGTGMLIAPDVLFDIHSKLDSSVEDVALSLLIFSRGVRVGRIEHAVVYDPVPDSAPAASRQRARWFRGQWRAAWQYRREISSVLIKGPEGWSLLSSLFLKPRWLVFAVCSLLAIALSRWWWAALLFWAYVLFGLLYLIIGLLILPDRKSYFTALLYLPSYVQMWIRSIFLSLRATPWLKAREE